MARFTDYLAERTRSRILVLFTNADDLTRTGRELEDWFAALHVPFWYRRMDGTAKEELGELLRTHIDSVLFGLDTFWYGTDIRRRGLERPFAGWRLTSPGKSPPTGYDAALDQQDPPKISEGDIPF